MAECKLEPAILRIIYVLLSGRQVLERDIESQNMRLIPIYGRIHGRVINVRRKALPKFPERFIFSWRLIIHFAISWLDCR